MNEFIALVVLLFFSGVFSGSEAALVALTQGRVEGLLKEGRGGAQALSKLKSDPSQMLITILIGNNLVNIAASALATVIATEWFGRLGPGIAVGVLTIVILIFGEITPKSLATRYAERICWVLCDSSTLWFGYLANSRLGFTKPRGHNGTRPLRSPKSLAWWVTVRLRAPSIVRSGA